jgi:flagellar basal body L-ring protein FlgH
MRDHAPIRSFGAELWKNPCRGTRDRNLPGTMGNGDDQLLADIKARRVGDIVTVIIAMGVRVQGGLHRNERSSACGRHFQIFRL